MKKVRLLQYMYFSHWFQLFRRRDRMSIKDSRTFHATKMTAVCKYIIESANIYQVDGQILAKLVTNLSWPVGSGWSGGQSQAYYWRQSVPFHCGVAVTLTHLNKSLFRNRAKYIK